MASEASLAFPQQALRQGGEFRAGIRAPHHPAIVQQTNDDSTHGAAQRLDPITGLEIGRSAQLIHDLRHRPVIQHARDTMGDGGSYLSAARRRKFGKHGGGNLPSDVGKGVTVEEKERGAPMAVAEELYRFVEVEDGATLLLPLSRCRFLSLSIKAVLRSTSFARSSVEADDKLPTPVFDKSGSAL